MKPLSAIVAVVTLVLTVIFVASLIVSGPTSPYSLLRTVTRYNGYLAIIALLLIALTVIFAAISAVRSPQAPLTRVVFCGLAALFGLVGVSTTLHLLQMSTIDHTPPGSVWFLAAVFMAGTALPSMMTIALARNVTLLYSVYGLVMPTWLISFGVLYLDMFLRFYGTYRGMF